MSAPMSPDLSAASPAPGSPGLSGPVSPGVSAPSAQTTAITDGVRVLACMFALGSGLAFCNKDGSADAEYASSVALKLFSSLAVPLILAYRSYYRGQIASRYMEGLGSGSPASFSAPLMPDKQVGEQMQTTGFKASPIGYAIAAVQSLELMTGFGPPEMGDDLRDGSEKFTKLAEQLAGAQPDDSWQGSGKEGYAESTTNLQGLAQLLADKDNELADAIKHQGICVEHIRLSYAILTDLLVVSLIISIRMKLEGIGAYGAAEAAIFEKRAAYLGAGLGASLMVILIGLSGGTADKINGLIDDYDSLAANAPQGSTTGVQAHGLGAAESSVSSFQDISDSMSGASAKESASAEQPRGLEAFATDDETPKAGEDGTPADPLTPSATPAFTMPTLAQLGAISGQAPKISGDPFDQTTRHGQQFASMTQQRRVAGAPGEEAVAAEDVAGAGADRAEGAPIEVAGVGAEQLEQNRYV